MRTFIVISDLIIFIIFSINVLYILFFSIISLFKSKSVSNNSTILRKFAILIPAYKEDSVIMECVESCINQDYPSGSYDVIVISDQMQDDTLNALGRLPITVVNVSFKNSTKSKALNYAMSQIGEYDVAVILDADNIIGKTFLCEVNSAYENEKVKIVQAHRIAKNTNTDLAYLDAISEEINNSIFRKAHSNIGLSAALIGSGMAFEYKLFKSTMSTVDAIGGFDKALELTMTHSGTRTYYLNDTLVLDEKVQSTKDFSKQRRRWISAQYHYFGRFIKYFLSDLMKGNLDFCDKLFQQITIPRILLLGMITIVTIIMALVAADLAVKWWCLLVCVALSIFFAIPRKMYNKKMAMALLKVPYIFLVFAETILHIRKANKTFIHTSHGIKK